LAENSVVSFGHFQIPTRIIEMFSKNTCTTIVISLIAGASLPSNMLSAQTILPNEQIVPPNFSTATIDDDRLRFVILDDVVDYKSEVVEIPLPVRKQVEESYSVKVPYTVEENGQKVTKLREEQKTRIVTRTVFENKRKIRKVPFTRKGHVLHEVSLAKTRYNFASLDGQSLKLAEVKRRLENWSPVIVLEYGEGIADYFRLALNSEIVLIIKPKPNVRHQKALSKPKRAAAKKRE